MYAKLEEVIVKHDELLEALGSPEVLADPKKMMELNKALNDMTEIVEKYREYKRYQEDLDFIKTNIRAEKDPDMKDMMQEEMREIEDILPEIENQMKVLLLPKDPNDDRSVIIEIRGGAGGDEAALFAGNLF
ncbi:MAG: PCRF domain-containing protein, partial [Cetobacterium sp.]